MQRMEHAVTDHEIVVEPYSPSGGTRLLVDGHDLSAAVKAGGLHLDFDEDGKANASLDLLPRRARVQLPVASIRLINDIHAELGDSPLDAVTREFLALTPEVEQFKQECGHGDCDGWSLSGRPQAARCGCGTPLDELTAQDERSP